MSKGNVTPTTINNIDKDFWRYFRIFLCFIFYGSLLLDWIKENIDIAINYTHKIVLDVLIIVIWANQDHFLQHGAERLTQELEVCSWHCTYWLPVDSDSFSGNVLHQKLSKRTFCSSTSAQWYSEHVCLFTSSITVWNTILLCQEAQHECHTFYEIMGYFSIFFLECQIAHIPSKFRCIHSPNIALFIQTVIVV